MERNSSRSARSRPTVNYAESLDSEDSNVVSIVSTDEEDLSQDDFNPDDGDEEEHKHGKEPVSKPSTAKEDHGKAFRHEISSETAIKRASFFIAKKDSFLPLLPTRNLIEKLIERRKASGHALRDKTVPYQKLEKQPNGIKATMKPYQLDGLSFLVHMNANGMSAILGDEMGLGKTLQTLSLLQYLKNANKKLGSTRSRPSLVVCPLSVLNSWMNEATKWTPGLKVLRFHGPSAERERVKQIASGATRYTTKKLQTYTSKGKTHESKQPTIINLDSDSEDELAIIDDNGLDLIVTTYEGFLAEESWFKRAFVWRYVILDEGHRIKNESSLISKALHGVSAEYRLLLSGTPLQNNLKELWALLHWLYPELFTDQTSDLFQDSFNLTKGLVSTSVMDASRLLLETIMLRRLKESPGVDLNLPPKNEVLLYVPLTPMQRFWYMRLLTRVDRGLLDDLFNDAGEKEALLTKEEADPDLTTTIREKGEIPAGGQAVPWDETRAIMEKALQRETEVSEKKPAWRKLMNLLMQLRKCCNHPYLLPHAEPDPYYLGEHVTHASAKFIVLEKMLDELVVKQRKKVIIFSGFVGMLDLCEDLFATRAQSRRHINHIRLDGATSRARRNLNIRMFNQTDGNQDVILISTRAGGLGINLAAASEVILLDEDWNPQITLQAEARAHRIGQKNPVTVYKLCTQGTVEEQMQSRIQKKLYLSAKVTEAMRDLYGGQSVSDTGEGAKEDNVPQMSMNKLMSLVRRGTQTLARPEVDVNEMLSWDWQTVLHKCKDQVTDSLDRDSEATKTDEDPERKWLSQIEQVQSRIFNGKKQEASKASILIDEPLSREDRRIGKNTTVMVDGHAVSKESLRCGDWEAVPTYAGKDPRLAEPKREKQPPIISQSVSPIPFPKVPREKPPADTFQHCQGCHESSRPGKPLKACTGCPRSFHQTCLSDDLKIRARAKFQFMCSQHRCADCLQNTQNAGGMLFRCRWCADAYCEDCLDWEQARLIGGTVKEFEMLGFPEKKQAYFIVCHRCNQDQSARKVNQGRERQIDLEYEDFLSRQKGGIESEDSDDPEGLPLTPDSSSERSTQNTSAVTTPPTDVAEFSFGNKRKFSDAATPVTDSKRRRLMRGLAGGQRATTILP